MLAETGSAADLNLKGLHLMGQRMFVPAFNYFDKAVDIDPTFDAAWENRSIAFRYIHGEKPK
jgi:lipoprotein NlpI